MVEVWLWDKTDEGSITEVKKFDDKEKADRYVDFNRRGRSVVYVHDDKERGNVWRLIGARCPM